MNTEGGAYPLYMRQVRKAHSVEIIDRQLQTCEAGGSPDVMELIGLHDELCRVERKWLAKAAELRRQDPRTRPLANAGQMNDRFARLARLVDAALRRTPAAPTADAEMLRAVAAQLNARKPLPGP